MNGQEIGIDGVEAAECDCIRPGGLRGRSGLRAIGGTGGRPHRLERLRRERPEGVLHRLAADRARSPGATASRAEVQRGDIRLFVAFRPGENVSNEVSFTGGYPFREGSTVTLAVGSDSFTLGSGTRRLRRVGLDRPVRRRPRGRGDAPRRPAAKRDRHLGARHHHRGHLLAVGLHRRGRGRRGALPLRRRLAISAGNGYVGRRRRPRPACATVERQRADPARRHRPAAPAGRRRAAEPRRDVAGPSSPPRSPGPARPRRRWRCGSARSGSGSTTAAPATSRR